MTAHTIIDAVEHLLVDVPTESGPWCRVTDDGIVAPVEVFRSVWTEYVDAYGYSISDENDDEAMLGAREVERVSLRIENPGTLATSELPSGGKWLRFDDLTAAFAGVIAERDELRAAAEGIDGIPTDAAIARAMRDGCVVVAIDGLGVIAFECSGFAAGHAEHNRANNMRTRWLLLRDGRPEAWPAGSAVEVA